MIYKKKRSYAPILTTNTENQKKNRHRRRRPRWHWTGEGRGGELWRCNVKPRIMTLHEVNATHEINVPLHSSLVSLRCSYFGIMINGPPGSVLLVPVVCGGVCVETRGCRDVGPEMRDVEARGAAGRRHRVQRLGQSGHGAYSHEALRNWARKRTTWRSWALKSCPRQREARLGCARQHKGDTVGHDSVVYSRARHSSARHGGAGRTSVIWLIVERGENRRRSEGIGL